MIDTGKDQLTPPQNIGEETLPPSSPVASSVDLLKASQATSLKDLVIQDKEKKVNPETLRRFKAVLGGIEGILVNAHNLLDDYSGDIEKSLWADTDERLLQATGLKEVPLRGANIIMSEESGLRVIVYFPKDVIERVANTEENELFNNEQYYDNIATVIEETSHYIYTDFYKRIYGSLPNLGMMELIGALDRYNVAKFLSQETRGKPLSPEEYVMTVLKNEEAFFTRNRGQRDPAYIIGHELGVQYLQILDHMRDSGQNVDQEFGNLYKSPNDEQVRHLTQDLGLRVNTYSEQEKQGVGELLSQASRRQ